jgi:hypothetical protein
MAGPIITRGNGKDALWPFGAQSSTIRSLETAFRATLGLKGRLQDARGKLQAEGRTPALAATEAGKAAREQTLPDIVRADLALQAARKSAKDRLAALKPTAHDAELATFLKRERLRDIHAELRRMPREQRDQMLTAHADELDPETVALALALAVALPWTRPEAQFISPETRRVLERRILPADELGRIDELQEAIAYAAPTIEQGKLVTLSELKLSETEFAALVRTEAAKTTIWLKKDGARTVVMIPEPGKDTFTSRPATEDEIANGTLFSPEAYAAAATA